MKRKNVKYILTLVFVLMVSLGLVVGQTAEATKPKPAGSKPAAPAAKATGPDTTAKVPATAKPKREYEKLVYPKLNQIAQPTVVRETMPNGIRLLLVEDHELPMVNFRALIRGGRLAEGKQNGLIDLFGEVLRTGGTQKMSGDQMDEFLEHIGASIEADGGIDNVSVGGQTLVEHLDKVLPLFADVVLQPAFAQDKLDLAKTHIKSGISRRNDNVQGIGQREIGKLIYGADSVYARQYEYDDINAIKRDDLVKYHAGVFRPDQVILAVWGDFKVPEMKQRLQQLFGEWKASGPAPVYTVPEVPAAAYSVNYIEKKDIEQTNVYMGQPGLRYDDPDYAAVYVLSDILGGGFASRIFVHVRTDKGLAYGAGGYMRPAYDHRGVFAFYTSTKPSTTAEAISTIIEDIKLIREQPVSDEELQRAKESYLNSSAFEYDSRAKVIYRTMSYDFYGYPADFNIKLRNAVEKVTKDDVLRVAKKYLQPDKLCILAIGIAEKFDKPLSTFGQVKTIDITIPEPKTAEIPAATPESLAKGKALIQKLAKARGESAILGLKDILSEGLMAVETPMGNMEMKFKLVILYPDRFCITLVTPMGEVVMALDGASGWVKQGPQVMPLPGSQLEEMKNNITEGFGCLALVKAVLEGKLEVQALGPANFENQPAEALVVTIGGKPVQLFLSADGASLLGLRGTAQTREGPKEVTTVFSDYKEFDGISVPTQTIEKADGKTSQSLKDETVKVNTGVEAKVFQKPEK